MADSIVLLVLPAPGFQWRVEDGDSHEILSFHRTKPEALRTAKEILRRSEQPGTLRIHDIHGQFHAEHHYGMPREKSERVMVGGGAA